MLCRGGDSVAYRVILMSWNYYWRKHGTHMWKATICSAHCPPNQHSARMLRAFSLSCPFGNNLMVHCEWDHDCHRVYVCFICFQYSSQPTWSDADQRISSSILDGADCAHALFVRATYLVCHRLISSWKTDLNVSLAALELLSGLARMNIKDSGKQIWLFNLVSR